MPVISRFYGIRIYMYQEEHGIPHFHAFYGGQDVSIAIGRFRILSGSLPQRAIRLLQEWADAHQHELAQNWERVRRGEQVRRIAPLP